MKATMLLPVLLMLAGCSTRPADPAHGGNAPECSNGGAPRPCMPEAERTRRVQMHLDSGVAGPAPVTFHCDGDSRPLTAVFYNDLDPEAAVLTWGGDRAIVFPAVAASGARYIGNGVEFWEHQGVARVDFRGHPLVCRPAP